ncbi:hypothetical protein ACP70R_005867 [Stipagrostis hirtigluma subsp. patula]
MMGLSAAVRWWEESQLRVLVLASLFLQFFLLCTAAWRMSRIPSWLRSCIWLAYLGSDAAAIYALATLFNRHKLAPANGSILEVLWAPVLLIHLGGPISISAYNMEDNELWPRHVLTLLSQVSVSLYVFCKSWPADGERLLFQTAALLFTIGIIRFSTKPWALKSASINNLVPTRESLYGRRKMFRFFVFYWAQNTSDAVAWQSAARRVHGAAAAEGITVTSVTDEDISIQEYVRQAKKICVDEGTTRYASSMSPGIRSSRVTEDIVFRMLVDAYRQLGPRLLGDSVLHSSDRLKALRSFLELDDRPRMQMLEVMLHRMFNLLYTKEKVYLATLGHYVRCITLVLSFAAIGMFAKAHKDGYSKGDVTVTYILLCFNAATEMTQYCPILLPLRLREEGVATPVRAIVAQQNLMSFVARRNRPTRWMMLAALIRFDDYVNKHWHVGHSASSLSIMMLVLRQLEDGWMEDIQDAASFRRFNDRRGHWTLKRSSHKHVVRRCSSQAQAVLLSSLQLPFDESVVIWHIATDLCFHHPDATRPPPQDTATTSRDISNYMIYMFFLRLEMLIPGARKDMLITACDDIEGMLKHDDEPPLDERSLAQGIIHKQRHFPWVFSDITSPLIPKACKLAEALMEISGVEERWKVIQGVWVEMLCYSASNCRGYLHSKSLGEGGEFLSYVWLLLAHMGMETFADKFNRPNLFEDDDTASAATADGGSASSPHQDGVPTAPDEITPATA